MLVYGIWKANRLVTALLLSSLTLKVSQSVPEQGDAHVVRSGAVQLLQPPSWSCFASMSMRGCVL